jgi:hypothetical protein
MNEITVELFDGTVLKFPEGTSPDVINRIAKEQTLARRGEAEQKPGLVERAGRWLTGADRDPNIPGPMGTGLPMTPAQSAQMTALLSTTMSPDRLERGIKKIEPDAQFQTDSYGNQVALWPRKNERGEVTGFMRFYPNPAGLDVSDVMRGSGAVAAALPVGRALKMIGLPTTGVLGGATLGATEAGLIEAASSRMTDSPYQVSDLAYGAAGGAAGEKIARAVQNFASIARARGPSAVVDASGNLLPQYADLVRKAGLDPDQVSAAVAANIANATRAGVEPEQAAISAMSRGLPVEVPMTKGQLTGQGGQQLFEDVAGKGGYGGVAETLMRGQRSRQQEALQANLDRFLEDLAPGAAPISRGEGGERAQESLVRQRDVAKADANLLYTEARAAPATVDPAAAGNVATSMRGAFQSSFSPRTAPTMSAMLDDFDSVAATGDIRSMMEWRSQVTSLRKGAPTVEGAAATQVLNEFDARIIDTINNALLAGDADAVAKWGAAISNYADFAAKWKSGGGILKLLTERAPRDGQMALVVAPKKAADTIFAATASNLAAKTGLPRDLMTLRANLPTEEWNALRQEAFFRLADTAKGGMRGGEQQISGVNFKKAWDTLRERNPGVVNVLFTKDEQKVFSQFANVAARATNTLANTSNTAAAMSGIIQRLGGMLGQTGVGRLLARLPIPLLAERGLMEVGGGIRAAGAVSPGTPIPRTPMTIGGAGAGAAAATSGPGQEELSDRWRGFLGIPR